MGKIPGYARKIYDLYGLEKGLWFFLSSTWHSRVQEPWLEYIETQLPACTTELTRIRLAMRPVYRYMRPWLKPSHKVNILTYYYTALKNRFSPQGIAHLLRPEGHDIVELTGKSGRKYSITMLTETIKEGAFKFLFFDLGINECLAKITGIIGVDEKGEPVLWIGGLQGSNPPIGLEEIAFATKDLNGLRPKQAVFHTLCASAEWFGVKRVLAPSRDNQIAMKTFYKSHKVFNDYDSFWSEFMTREANGDYSLPIPPPRRDISEVPSKRKKDWLLRYERIDTIYAAVRDKMNSFVNKE